MTGKLLRAGALALALLSAPAWAALDVPPAYRQVAREYDVPASLLFAVALVESGRLVQGGRILPWPWTINAGGRGHYFRSRRAAEARLRRLLADGVQPDVGLMQLNWKYHRDELGSAAQAFDPWLNLRAGALALRRAYERTGDWWKAVGRYHSANPALAERYRRRVARWHRRIG